MNRFCQLYIILITGLAMTLGCTPSAPSGIIVRGSVTVEAAPLDEGLITLVPTGGTTGKKCSVEIHHGKYEFDALLGLAPGEYRVEVMGLPPGIKAMAEGKLVDHSDPKHKSTYREIAPEFNERSILRCSLVEGRENTADYQVKYVP